MRKIAVFNQKGGVGKTTTSVNIAAGLSRNNKRVILIDLDPQGDISVCHNTNSHYSLYDYVHGEVDLPDCISHLGKNLDLIHCDHRMADAESKMSKENNINLLSNKLSRLDYEYVIMDCPPSWRTLSKSILLYASEVMIPSSTDFLGYDSLNKTIKRITEFNKANGTEVTISSILPTLFDRRNKVCNEILAKMKTEFTPMLVADPVRSNSKLKEAPKAKMSIFTYDKKSSGAEDYWKLVKLMLENEYMYDMAIPASQREKGIREYFVNGKKREMILAGNRVTFGFKFINNNGDSLKLHFAEPKRQKRAGHA